MALSRYPQLITRWHWPRCVAARRSGRSNTLVNKKRASSGPIRNSTAAFSALNFAEAHSAISVRESPSLLVRFAQSRTRLSGPKQAGARNCGLVYKQNARLLRSMWIRRREARVFQPLSFHLYHGYIIRISRKKFMKIFINSLYCY